MLFGLNSILENTNIDDSSATLSPYAAQEIAYESKLALLKLKEYECECENTVIEQFRNAKYADSSVTMESFAPQLKVVQEGFLKNWYEKVKKFLAKIWNSIKNFFAKIRGKITGSTENFRVFVEKNKAKFDKIPDDYSYKATAIDYFTCDTKWNTIFAKVETAIKQYTSLIEAGDDANTESPLEKDQTADAYVADKLGITLDNNKSLTTALTKLLHGDKDKPGEIEIKKSTITFQNIMGKINNYNTLEKQWSNLEKDIEKGKQTVEALIKEGLKADDKADDAAKKAAKDKTEKALKAYQDIIKAVTSVIQTFLKEVNAARSFVETVTKDALGKATDKKDDTKGTGETETQNDSTKTPDQE